MTLTQDLVPAEVIALGSSSDDEDEPIEVPRARAPKARGGGRAGQSAKSSGAEGKATGADKSSRMPVSLVVRAGCVERIEWRTQRLTRTFLPPP